MSSILDIDSTLEYDGEDFLALHYLICYFGYCNNEQLPDRFSHEKLLTSRYYIELPEKYLATLEDFGYIKRISKSGISQLSTYFSGFSSSYSINYIYNTNLCMFEIDQRVHDEYIKFHKKPQEYKIQVIREFLCEIQDYINNILQNHYNQLAQCC